MVALLVISKTFCIRLSSKRFRYLNTSAVLVLLVIFGKGSNCQPIKSACGIFFVTVHIFQLVLDRAAEFNGFFCRLTVIVIFRRMHVAVKRMTRLSVQFVISHAFYRRAVFILYGFYFAMFIVILQNFPVGLFNAAQITEFIRITYSNCFVRVFALAFFYSYAAQRCIRIRVFTISVFIVVQEYFRCPAFTVILVLNRIVSATKFYNFSVTIYFLRAVSFAVFGTLRNRRNGIIITVSVSEFTAIGKRSRANSICSVCISILRFVLA